MTHAWHDAYRHPSTPAHHLDPRTKWLAAVSFVAVVLLSGHLSRAQTCGFAGLLVVCIAASRLPPRLIAGRLMTLLPFIALTALSTIFSAIPRDRLLQALAKSFLCLGAIATASLATPFPDTLRALEHIRLPKILVLFLAFVYRYVAVLGEEVVRLERGWSARYFGRRAWLQWGRLGQAVAALFIRSYERAERVYAAMLARGFSEKSSLVHVLHFGWADAFFAVLFAAAISVVRWGRL